MVLAAVGWGLLVTTAGAAPPCPVLADSGNLEASLRAAIQSDPDCAPQRALELGRYLTGDGRGEQAIGYLIRAVLDRPADRGTAYVALAEAQALAGREADALRSLTAAQRHLDPAHPSWPRSVDDATLLARTFLLRGGTLTGAYRYDRGYAPRLPGGRLRAIASGDDGLVAITAKTLLTLADDGRGKQRPLAARAVDIAVADGRPLALLEDAQVQLGGVTIRLPGASRPVAIAADHTRIAVIAGGRLLEYSTDGQPVRALKRPDHVIDVAIDPFHRRHLLLDDARGIAVISRDGAILRTIPARGDGWAWRDATALAVDRLGNSYVLCRSPEVIYVFGHGGGPVGRLDPPAATRKLLHNARGLSVAADGSLLVLADRGKRLVRYR